MSGLKIIDPASRMGHVALVCAVACAAPAGAQVLEIGPDGELKTRATAGAVEWAIGGTETEAANAPQLSVAAVPAVYRDAILRIAVANGISPALLAALVWQESRWRAAAVSPAGAIGLTQLMPDTARELGVDPRDPIENLAGGARYLRQLLDRFDGNVEHALAAYNAGARRVLRAGGVPNIAETRAYVANILGRMASATFPGE